MKKTTIAILIFLLSIIVTLTNFALKPPHINNAVQVSSATSDEYLSCYFSKKYNTAILDENDKYTQITYYDEVDGRKIKYGIILPYSSTEKAGLENIPQTAGYFLEDNFISIAKDTKEFTLAKVDIENNDTFRVQIRYNDVMNMKKETKTVFFRFHSSIFTLM